MGKENPLRCCRNENGLHIFTLTAKALPPQFLFSHFYLFGLSGNIAARGQTPKIHAMKKRTEPIIQIPPKKMRI